MARKIGEGMIGEQLKRGQVEVAYALKALPDSIPIVDPHSQVNQHARSPEQGEDKAHGVHGPAESKQDLAKPGLIEQKQSQLREQTPQKQPEMQLEIGD